MERFGEDDGPVIAAGSKGEVDGICQLGELTDAGRQTTYDLGRRLRHLYVDQLKFMPALISDSDMIYLRSTPIPRALESVQQTFWGMYPLTARTASFPAPTIVTRTPADETLFPNDGNCRRFAQLSRAFAQRTADRWNDSDDMNYLNKLISKWMPEASPTVAVDGHPRLSGIMDTINSTLAHGPETRLPKEFYDEKGRAIIDKIGVEEWFSGYAENKEYRRLGIGALAGDIVERMGAVVDGSGLSINEIGGENGHAGTGRGGEKSIRFALSGCHDTTLAALLTGLGAFDGEKWPPYTSHIAVEMFREKALVPPPPPSDQFNAPTSGVERPTSTLSDPALTRPGWLAGMLGLSASSPSSSASSRSSSTGATGNGIARRPFANLDPTAQQSLSGYYVRLRYNDKVMRVPACAPLSAHWKDDDSICTLETFKRVVDGFTPKNWKKECGENLNGGTNGDMFKDIRPSGQEQWAGNVEVDS